MGSTERPKEVSINIVGNFYSQFIQHPKEIIRRTRGIDRIEIDKKVRLDISEDILDSTSLFFQYLSLDKSQRVFGQTNLPFENSALLYERGIPIKINHFNTRLLLAFFEVQWGLGFSGRQLEEHQRAIINIINGSKEKTKTNLYNPFTHEDDLGIHYVQARDGTGGYDKKNWENFLGYLEKAMRLALKIDPVNLSSLIDNSEEAIKREIDNIDSSYKQTDETGKEMLGKINIQRIRSVGQIVSDILLAAGIEHTPFIDYLLDMPYKNNAIVTFQSMCSDS